MKLIEKIKNRYNILSFILLILMGALSLRLATLTIAEGDYYRHISDNKRLKEMQLTPPRGEIRDRYGRLLAGNKSSFTVQILKDIFNTKDRETKNQGLLSLIRLLEEDGVGYIDEFPIEFNTFKYKNESLYNEEDLKPRDKVIEIIIENNLLPELLNTYYKDYEYKEHYQFITANRAISALENKGINMPILTKIDEDGLNILYDDGKKLEPWRKQYNIPQGMSPIDAIVKIINKDKNIIMKVMDHPISRNLAYNILEDKGLIPDIELAQYTLSYEEEYQDQKRQLMKLHPEVDMNTTGREDFINIVAKVGVKPLLEKVVVTTDGNKEKIFIPGTVLLDIIKEKDKNLPIDLELNDDNTKVQYKYTGENNLGDMPPMDALIEYAKRSGFLEKFITHDKIKSLAQEELLTQGINTRISVAKDIEYVFINNKNNWFTENRIEEGSSIEEAFLQLRKRYEIDEELSRYEARSILGLYQQIGKQGYMAYQPINIAYGIKDYTVARIEEGLMDFQGIQVSIEPVRYYPQGDTASHILGYIGKISQAKEIKKYIEEQDYSPSTLIGKTGIEEAFEEQLRGKSGIKKVEVDSLGNTTKLISEQKPVPGDNIYLTIDLKLQQVAERAMEKTLKEISRGGVYESPWGDYQFGINRKKNRPYINATSGAVMAIDVKTGQTLAMVSYPGYDPNLFSTGISTTDWLSLLPEHEKDPLAPRPLYNIATLSAIQPGSTFKMVPALAALEKGLSPTTKIRDMGYVEVGSEPFNCLIWTQSRSTHGYENVYEALRDSCNYYFYTLMLGRNQKTNENLGVKVEIEDIVDLSKKLGLNDKTGIEINIPQEYSGGVPNPQRKLLSEKATLRRELNGNIEKYLKEDREFTEEDIKNIVDEIVEWTELEETLTRAEVVRRLNKLGVYPEKRLPNTREGLADRIKYSYLDQVGWKVSDSLNVSIGQGQNSYTVAQMANFMSILSNGGYKRDITLIDNIKNYNNSTVNYKHEVKGDRIQLNNYNNLEHIKKGMLMVSEEGTARRIFDKFPVKVGSKTGTAEKSGINPVTGDTYDDFAWFVGFAPYEDPEIAVAAVIFQGGSGGYATPMVRDIIAEYLGLNSQEINENLPFENILTR